jgi:FtsX-like permease family
VVDVRPVIYRIRTMLVNRLLATVIMTVVIAIVCGVVLAFAAGARRTSTAPDRYTGDFGSGFDALVTQDDGNPSRDREVASLPGVAEVDPMTFVFGGLQDPNGQPLGDASVFSGSYRPGGVRLVHGRAPDATKPNEFVATPSFVKLSNGKLGDSFDLVTLTPAQAHAGGFSLDDPQGPKVKVVLVGIVDGAVQLEDPTPFVVISPALLSQYQIGVSATLMSIDLRPGTDLTAFRSQLDTLAGGDSLTLDPNVLISQPVRNAVQAQARGLWILAVVAAIAALAVLGQVITRQVRPAEGERTRLSAIGFTRVQVLAEAVGRAVIPITIGSILGAILAIVPSSRFPVGFARVLEPHPGLRIEWSVLLAGTALFLVALIAWTVAALALSSRPTRAVRPSRVVEAMATRAASPTAGVGMRLAFTRGARERGAARGAMVAVGLSVAGVVAAVTFGVSLNRLVHETFRYGANFDISVGDNGADTLPDGMAGRLEANPDVKSLTLYAGTEARFGDRSIPILGFEAVRGDGAPTVLEGRLPASEDEIAFGRLTASDLGAHVGDEISLNGALQANEFRVTGLAVVPGLGSNDGIGEGGIVTMQGLSRLDDTAQVTNAAVQLRGTVQEFAATIPELGDTPPSNYIPTAIANVTRIRAIPFVLAAVLAALALLTVGHAMLMSMRSRRRDLAILRSLGADRGWIRRAVHWQATLLTTLPVLVGVPAGIVVGRLVFLEFADSMGAVDDAAIPLLIVLIGAIATVIVANAIAAVTSRRGRRREPALLLQSE